MNKQKTRNDGRKAITQGFIEIPTFLFKDRSVAVLEALVEYLKDHKELSFHEIAMLLNRNDRTIWTVYRRAKLKRKGIIKSRD
jgi:hypothetical protein